MNKPKSLFSKIIKLLIIYTFLIFSPFVTLALLLFLFQQMFSKIYNFKEQKQFTGKNIYNPYQNLDDNWYKANFHAHSIAHLGLTNGNQTPKELINKYNSLGYDIAEISNYHQITDEAKSIQKLFIPCYEHGYNIMKSHRLCVGSKEVSYQDFILHIFLSNKQQLIDNLKQENDLVAIAHPKFRNGHTEDDMKLLSGYDCIEVLNHYRNSSAHWDSALSAGIPAYIIADDDCHNSDEEGETGVNWTMINADTLSMQAVLNSLKIGKAYGVEGRNAKNKMFLQSVSVINDTIKTRFTEKADSIILIGQYGKIKKMVSETDSIEYLMDNKDTYIRTVAYLDSTVIYLNPLIRYEKHKPINNTKAEINYVLSYSWRFLAFVLFMTVLYFYYRNLKFFLFTYRKK